jgi:hypothetical protein
MAGPPNDPEETRSGRSRTWCAMDLTLRARALRPHRAKSPARGRRGPHPVPRSRSGRSTGPGSSVALDQSVRDGRRALILRSRCPLEVARRRRRWDSALTRREVRTRPAERIRREEPIRPAERMRRAEPRKTEQVQRERPTRTGRTETRSATPANRIDWRSRRWSRLPGWQSRGERGAPRPRPGIDAPERLSGPSCPRWPARRPLPPLPR